MVRGLEFLKNNQGSPNEDLLELSEVLVQIAIIIEPFIPGDDGITITRNIQSILSLVSAKYDRLLYSRVIRCVWMSCN